MPRFAANISFMFTEVPFRERFAAARRAGFGAVEFSLDLAFSIDELDELLTANALDLALFNMPKAADPYARGIAAVPGQEAAFRAQVERSLAYAEVLRPACVHGMSGDGTPDDPAARAALVGNLRQAADRFAEAGLTLVIEPLNPRDIPGYFLNDFDQALDIIADVGRPNLSLQFDIYHRQIVRGDVMRGIEQALPFIRHVQIAGVPDRHEPGTGELNDAAVLRHLDALGYTGFVGCEYRPAGRTEDGLGWLRAFRSKEE
jgi:hydroxypyruvate isomerase